MADPIRGTAAGIVPAGGGGAATLTRANMLDEVNTILGDGANTFWPGLVTTGSTVEQYPTNTRPLTAVEALDNGNFTPEQFAMEAYTASGDGAVGYTHIIASSNKMEADDAAAFTFGDGTVDSPFSAGAWIKPTGLATHQMIISKWENTNTLREWELFVIATTGILEVVLYDESANATETADGIAPIVAGRWVFCVFTYDGDEATPVINIYQNGSPDRDADGPASTEAGTYTAMEDTSAPLMVGARGNAGAAILPFAGDIALPFVAEKELSATEVRRLTAVTSQLLGGP